MGKKVNLEILEFQEQGETKDLLDHLEIWEREEKKETREWVACRDLQD